MDPKALKRLFDTLSHQRLGQASVLDFGGADLRGALLVRAVLSGGDFTEARMQGANLSGTKCVATRLSWAQLQGATLNGADLTGAILHGADLSEVRLEGVCLAEADCTAAKLWRVQGMPSSVARMRIDQTTVHRSKLTDREVIEYYLNGATLVDIEQFSTAVRASCRRSEVMPAARAIRRKVSLDELPAVRANVEVPGSVGSIANAASKVLQSPHYSGLRSFIFLTTGDEYWGMRLGERLPAVGPVQCYAATTADGRHATLKLYDASLDARKSAATAFRRGVRNLSRICALGESSGVAIPKLLAVSVDELGFVTERLGNGNLLDLVALRWNEEQVLSFFRKLCNSVSQLHALGLLHRSLCPSTVLVGDELEPVLTDIDAFELSGQNGAEGSAFLRYAAPEELAGSTAYSPTADIYSLGRILQFLLTGEEPSPMEHENAEAPLPKGLSLGVARIVCKATQPSPAQRYQWVSALLDDLARHREADRVGCRTVLPAPVEPCQVSGFPPAPRTPQISIGGYPSLQGGRITRALPPPPASMLVHGLRALRHPGALLLCAGLALTFLPSVPSPDAGVGLAAAICLGAGLCVNYLPFPKRSSPRLRVLSSALVSLLLWQVGLSGLVAYRWAWTLSQGSPEDRTLAARYLVKTGHRDLRAADLSELHLAKWDLAGVDLRGATLVKTDLSGSTLAEADFAGANLTGADLRGTVLFRTNAPLALGWETIRCDHRTTMPRGWSCVDKEPHAEETRADR